MRVLVKGAKLTEAKHYLPAIIWLAAEHGAPRQEILDLEWSYVMLDGERGTIRFHDFRHAFCSNLAIAGASLKDIQKMTGHYDISMTDRYTHLSSNRLEL
ncbi:MAG: tyrosine-type recombinase/integrase [Candidatus Marinimicrobia bacterium]|nr:tyrosine-type recombinase/integrase [Candidatus Neomarinimicrobiota bacterium]